MKRAASVAIFVAAFVANRRVGTSPLLWSDTFNDQVLVAQCLVDDACTLVGVQTSIRGLFHAVGWLQLRTLVQWLGIGVDGLLLFVQVLNALAVTIVFLIAARLESLLAGTVAALILVFGIGHLSVPVTGLNNLSILLFLGAVLTLACTAVVQAPGIASVGLAALVAAVMANVHVSCVVTGVSVVWVALLAPHRRFRMAALAAALFAITTVAVAAPSWRDNLLGLFQVEPGGSLAGVGAAPPNAIIAWALIAIGAWGAACAARRPSRHAATGAVAVIVPTLTAFLAAPAFGFHAEPKYLTDIRAACATAAALPIGRALWTVLAVVLPARAFPLVVRALPFVAAIVIAQRAALGVAHLERALTVGDLQAVARILRVELGWDARQAVRAFTTLERTTALTGVLQADAWASAPAAQAADPRGIAALLTVPEAEIPDPPPASWHILRRAAGMATILTVDRARLDWTRFDLCAPDATGTDVHCDTVAWDALDPRGKETNALPFMPRGGGGWRGIFRLRLAILPDAAGPPGALFMPRAGACGGRILSITGTAAEISDDRRHATFVAAAPDHPPATVELEWNVGSPNCDPMSYDGLPPFLIEGAVEAVARLEGILRRMEARG